MRFGLICVEAFTAGIMPVVIVANEPLSSDQIQAIGDIIEADMLEIVGRPDGRIPFILPQDEDGRLFFVSEAEFAVLRQLFESLAWIKIHGLDDEQEE